MSTSSINPSGVPQHDLHSLKRAAPFHSSERVDKIGNTSLPQQNSDQVTKKLVATVSEVNEPSERKSYIKLFIERGMTKEEAEDYVDFFY